MANERPRNSRSAVNLAIWQIVKLIPHGNVATYGQVAQLSGLPRGARRVGAALKAAPPNATLPWHRVVNAQGKISLPQGSDAYAAQKNRLEREGVSFVNGRIKLDVYGWQQPLDALLWGPQ